MSDISDISGTDQLARRTMELMYGRKFTDEEWEKWKPGEGETLDEAISFLPRRTQGYERELSAVTGLTDIGTVLKKATSHDVLMARLLVFDTREPPFDNLREAWSWVIKEFLGEEAARNGARNQEISATPDASLLEWRDESILIKRAAQYYRLEGPTESWLIPALRLQSAVPSEEIGTRETVLWGMPHDDPNPEDIVVVVNTERLALLATFAVWLHAKAPCWSVGRCAAYILTGDVPKLPLIRVWIDELSGGARRVYLEINGPFGMTDMKAAYHLVREANGWYRKKQASTADAELVAFVEKQTPRLTWQQRFEKWIKEEERAGQGADLTSKSPLGRRISNGRSLNAAYKRARKRLTSTVQ